MKRTLPRNTAQAVIATVVVTGFFVVFAFLLLSADGADQGLREARLLMIGGLQAGFALVLGYYFGSTSGSERKTEMLANSTPTPPEPTVVTTTSADVTTSIEGKQP